MSSINGYTRGYVAGMVEMASELAGLQGPSTMTAELIDPDRLEDQLTEAIGGTSGLFEMDASESNLLELFTNCLGDTYDVLNACFRLMNKLRGLFGREQQVFAPVDPQALCEAYSGYSGGRGPFYIVENMFLIVFDKAAVLFVFGSDE